MLCSVCKKKTKKKKRGGYRKTCSDKCLLEIKGRTSSWRNHDSLRKLNRYRRLKTLDSKARWTGKKIKEKDIEALK